MFLQAAKGLSADDLKLVLEAKDKAADHLKAETSTEKLPVQVQSGAPGARDVQVSVQQSRSFGLAVRLAMVELRRSPAQRF